MGRLGRRVGIMLLGLALAAPLGIGAAAQSADRHAGYYYPEPDSSEVYKARARALDQANRSLRIGFVTGVSQQMAQRNYAPPYALFAKGSEGQKLIIVALRDGPMDTIYRARAVLADMTAMSRTLPIFAEFGVQDWFTFFDLAKMMGFVQITITDGRDFAHRVTIE